MKIKSLVLENFAKYSRVEVNFDENVTYLIGNNGAGKSGIGLNGIWFLFQGIAEKSAKGSNPLYAERFRFIGDKSCIAKGIMVLYDEKTGVEINVIRKMTKDGSNLSFEAPEGMELNQEWLNELFNLFLINPRSFYTLTPKEQSKVLGFDTSKFDNKLAELKNEFTLIGRDIKNIGELVPVKEVEKTDISEITKQRAEIVAFNDLQKAKQTKINEANAILKTLATEKEEILKKLSEVNARIEKGENFVKTLPLPEETKDLSEIDKKLSIISENNEKFFEYSKYVTKKQLFDQKQKELSTNKLNQSKCEQDRIEYIKSKKLPFENLTINEAGELLLSEKPIQEQYFSSGELLKIVPVLIGSLNPELKYVFIQNYNLLDENKQKEVEKFLLSKGFQLVIEMVGESVIKGKNCILLKDCKILEQVNDL